MTVAIIVQARMGSTRLPGKVLKPVLGRPLLDFECERLARVRRADLVHVATTDNPADLPIVTFCETRGIAVSRGPEHDVLERFWLVASTLVADVVVRVNADCPLIDPEVVDHVLDQFMRQPDAYDYASNILESTYPVGLHTEVMTFAALAQAHAEAREPFEREHVTPFIYRRPDRFRLLSVKSGEELGGFRWAVDTPADFELISNVLTALYPTKPNFGMRDVIDLLVERQDWVALNRHVTHKTVYL